MRGRGATTYEKASDSHGMNAKEYKKKYGFAMKFRPFVYEIQALK
jgi:hypothetical protein